VHALMSLEKGGPGLAGLIAALRAKDVALVAFCRERLGQIG